MSRSATELLLLGYVAGKILQKPVVRSLAYGALRGLPCQCLVRQHDLRRVRGPTSSVYSVAGRTTCRASLEALRYELAMPECYGSNEQ